MKLHILSAHNSGAIDGILMDRLLQHLPNRVSSVPDADVTLVCISFFENYKFGEHLRQLEGKRWALLDTCEWYGGWPDNKSHLFGISETPAFSGNPEWQKFSQWVKQNPPVIQFVRELFRDDVSPQIQPLEWPCYLPAWEMEPKLNYNTRPFEVFFQYGISSCWRPMLHGDMLKNSCREGYEVINSLDHIDAKINQPGRKWCAIHQPHTHRVNINEVVRRQAQSKLTVSLCGAGWKCFRSTEVVHSCPAIHSPGLAWSFPWIDKVNCIHLTPGREWIDLVEALRLDQEGHISLHEMYVAAQENLDRYRIPGYVNEHILPSLHAVI